MSDVWFGTINLNNVKYFKQIGKELIPVGWHPSRYKKEINQFFIDEKQYQGIDAPDQYKTKEMFDDKLFLKKPKKKLKYYPDRKKTQKFVIKLCDPSKFVPD